VAADLASSSTPTTQTLALKKVSKPSSLTMPTLSSSLKLAALTNKTDKELSDAEGLKRKSSRIGAKTATVEPVALKKSRPTEK
jgi:hypothetical protein